MSLLAVFLSASRAHADVVLPPDAGQFATGQIWTYANRDEDSGSTLVVCKVETFGSDIVVHVAVLDVNLSVGGESRTTTLVHIPISQAALAASVRQMSGTTEQLPPYMASYNQWRKDNGSIFTIPVARIVDELDGAMMPPDEIMSPEADPEAVPPATQ